MCKIIHPIILMFAIAANQSFSAMPAIKAALQTPAVAHLAEHVASGMVAHELLNVIHHWFSPENVQKNGEAACLAQVEQELKKINAKLAVPTPSATTVSVQQKQVVVQVNQQTTTINKVQSTAALNALQKNIGNRFKEVTGKVNTIVAQQTELLTLSKNNAAHTARIQQIQDSLARDRALIATGYDSLQSLATIASVCGNNKLAYQIGASGGAIMKMVDSTLALRSVQAQVATGAMSGATASMALAGGWAGIAVGFVSMLSSFLSEGNEEQGEAMQAIMDAICQLSKQMHQYHKETLRAFGDVQSHLQAQDIVMLQNFFELRVGQQDIKDQLRKIYKQAQQYNYGVQGSIGYLSELMQNQQRIITGDLASLRTEGILDLVEEVDQVAKAAHIPTTSFKDYSTKLAIKGANRAKGPYVTGDSIDASSAQAVCSALAPTDLKGNLWTHPAFSLVNLLRNYGPKNGAKTLSEPVINPLIWTQCAQALTLLFSKKLTDATYPEDQRTKELDLELIGQMHQEGTKFVGFVQEYGTQQNIDSFATAYAQSMDEFAAHVQSEIKEYEETQSKELCAEVVQKSETEMMQFQTEVSTCPNVVRLTEQAVEQMQAQTPYLKTVKDKLHIAAPKLFVKGKNHVQDSEHNQLMEVCLTKKTPENYNAFLAQEKKAFAQIVKQRINTSLPLCRVSITDDAALVVPEKKQHHSMCKVMISKPGCGYKTLLPVPYGKDANILFMPYRAGEQYESFMEKIKKYAVMEQRGIGSISYEYEPTKGFFYVRAFFNFKSGARKNILTLKREFENESLYPGGSDESLLTWWYGGRYPKGAYNKMDTSQFFFKKGSELHKKYRQNGQPKVCYYPSTEGYHGEKDFYVSGATLEPIAETDCPEKVAAECVAQIQAKERVQFNNKMFALVQPSTNSKPFSALQKVDMHHKVLESMVVLAYNEQMYGTDKKLRKEFDELQTVNATHLCDMGAIVKYMAAYSDKTSTLPLKPYALPQLLQQAKQAKTAALQRIKKLNLKAQFNCVSTALSKLDQLKKIYTQRIVPLPPTAAMTAPQNPDVAALREDNKKLTETVAGLQQQMSVLIALMQNQQLATTKK